MVLHTGSWDLGSPGKLPTPLASWRANLGKELASIRKSVRAPIALLSTSYTPLGKWHLACPPMEWRAPECVDAYNAVQREVAAEHGATFLDANALLGPVWDSSGDWNHWDHEGFAVMADLVVAARDRLAAA